MTSSVSVDPPDVHNQRLVAQVHPPTWSNPRAKPRYHLAVLGAGTGGLVCAAGAAGLGAKVALIEKHLMGGDCLNVGCVPSKALVAAARSWHRARRSQPHFGGPAAAGPGDFGGVMERLRRLRADLSPADGATVLPASASTCFSALAGLSGPTRFRSATRRFGSDGR